jgi:hypothetical protein
MTMFGITTFMLFLGIGVLALETTIRFLWIYDCNDSPSIYYSWATASCLMVRLRDAFMPSA